ncbi:MAG: hypothetical protein CVU34_04815 [Betaproteobacteria bacterium HGW-Betaproteobacteria-7]|jgi:hypothetical protein|nr:MAG: hypothetical protein CVU34_04815 [Betaproteobacteria bacterium HGW-Betaproteobacteria-7]
MKITHLALATVAALAAAPALAAPNWIGTADYGLETVGPFNTYDLSSAGVLLIEPLLDPLNPNAARGYYQSSVTAHLLDGLQIQSPGLAANNYELTIVADFNSSRTSVNAFGETFGVNSGNFALYLDTTPDRDFATDSGFTDGLKIMEGSITSGGGSLGYVGGGIMQFGGAMLDLTVTGYDTSVFSPATIAGGNSTFSLRLGAPFDATFLSTINNVQGVGTTGNLLYVADGDLILAAVPEPKSLAMMLAGLGMIGAMSLRRRS